MSEQGLTWHLDYDPERFSSGVMRMKIADCHAEVMEGDKAIGFVSGCIGGGIEVCVNGRTWFLGCEQLWNSATEADKAYAKETK